MACNLNPKALKGFDSHGMVMCATNSDKSCVKFVEPPEQSIPGELITLPGVEQHYESSLGSKALSKILKVSC